MATIKVDTSAIRDKATSFRTIESNITTYLQDMKQEMDSLKSVWEGESAETTVSKFSALEQKYQDEIKQTIDQYATYLDNAADSYDSTENSVTQGAESQA